MRIDTDDIIILQDATIVRFGEGTRIVFEAEHATIETEDSAYGIHWKDPQACLDFAVFNDVPNSGLTDLLAELHDKITAAQSDLLDAGDRAIAVRRYELANLTRLAKSAWVRAGRPVTGETVDAVRAASRALRGYTHDNRDAVARIIAAEAADRLADAAISRLRSKLQREVDRLVSAHRWARAAVVI